MSRFPVLPQGLAVTLSRSGTTGIVGPIIGVGGQGGVYLFDVGGRRLALKWYHPNVVRQDVGARARISRLVDIGPPDERYLWPIDLAEAKGHAEFGYVMPLMSGDRRPLKDIIAAPPLRIEMTLEARAVACFQVAESFQRLHAQGLCYQDVNLGAFFVDPVRGSVLICDADNISVDGCLGGVYGTRKFMAPEVARRESIPSMMTDLYSMAVLFFYILFGWHPLDGTRETQTRLLDAAAEQRLYATDPLFLFDPDNRQNGPVAGLHDWIVARWTAMPRDVRDLFTRSFTVGLQNGGAGRVVETEWRRAFARLRDAVARCTNCAFEAPFSVDKQDGPILCTACGLPVPKPTRIEVANYLIACLPGSDLCRHHVERGASIDLSDIVGRVEQHPKDASILGLKNLTDKSWTGQSRDGNVVAVAPDRTVRIVDGLNVDFGSRRGLVCQGDRSGGA